MKKKVFLVSKSGNLHLTEKELARDYGVKIAHYVEEEQISQISEPTVTPTPTENDNKKANKIRSTSTFSNENITSFVSLKDINKIYPNGAQAVYNFNLDIEKNDFIVLVGPSGCGKSTTLRMIAGLEDITSGTLYIDKVLANYLESKNRDISMVFQSYALYPQMTVYDNIGFPLKVRKYTKRAVDVKAATYARVIDLLQNNIVRVRKGLSNIQIIKGKDIHKIHYLERYLSCERPVAIELIKQTKNICDDFTLGVYHVNELLKNIIKRTKESLKNAKVILDDELNIIDDGRMYSKVALQKSNIDKLVSLIETDLARVEKALINAFDPRGDKHTSRVQKIEKDLEIDEITARLLVENNYVFVTNDLSGINAFKEALVNKSAELDTLPESDVPEGVFSNASTDEVKLLKDAIYYNDLATNHFTKLHSMVLAQTFDNVHNTILQIINKYKANDPEVNKAKIDDLVETYNVALTNRLNELCAEGYEVNERYELSFNGEPIFKKEKLTKDQIREKVFNAANVLDLGPYLDRRPKELSGGQMQRVALGRAIVRNAKLFLMDEPLSNLDAKLRVAMRSEIVRLHESINATTIYVTHDQTEAMTMATKIVIMSKGWVQQVGTPQEVYENPKNLFVATFIGSPAMNIIDAYLDGNVLTLGDGYRITLSEDFITKHNDFYRRKIVECDEMINTLNNEIEVKCYQILQVVFAMAKKYAQNREQILLSLRQIVGLAETLNKKSRNDLVGAAIQALEFASSSETYTQDVQRVFVILNNILVNYETINNADIEKIHSAQAFKKESNLKADSDMVYKGRKHEWFWTRMHKRMQQRALARRAPKVHIEDPKGYLLGLKEAYQKALISGHKVKIGIRPENVFLAKDDVRVNATTPFNVKVDVVELMGNESLIHSAYNGIDFLAKITSGTKVASHEEVELVLDKDKLHIFDINSGETII